MLRQIVESIPEHGNLYTWLKKMSRHEKWRITVANLKRECDINSDCSELIYDFLCDISFYLNNYPRDISTGPDVITNYLLLCNELLCQGEMFNFIDVSFCVKHIESVRRFLCDGKGRYIDDNDTALLRDIKDGNFTPNGLLKTRLPICWASSLSTLNKLARQVANKNQLAMELRNCLGLMIDEGDLVAIIYPQKLDFAMHRPTAIEGCVNPPFKSSPAGKGGGRTVHLKYLYGCSTEAVHLQVYIDKKYKVEWLGRIFNQEDINWRHLLANVKWSR